MTFASVVLSNLLKHIFEMEGNKMNQGQLSKKISNFKCYKPP